jgi:uncharacterized FlaG/YvyC family protein
VVRGEQIDAQELNALKLEDDSALMLNGDREIAIEQSTIPTITIQSSDPLAAETADGSNPGGFTIFRTGDTTNALSVQYTVSGSATNGVDYNQLTGTVTIAAGASSVQLPINVLEDLDAEFAETVTVTLTEDASYSLDNSYKSRTVKIQDNEKAKVILTLPDATAAETTDGSNPGGFTLYRTGDTTNALSVQYTVSGSATNGVDYSNLTGIATFAAGANTLHLPINVLDDLDAEFNENVTVTLTEDVSYTLDNSFKSRTVTIQDNEPTPFITLITPNGGENLKTGYNYGITWNDNLNGNVRIDLYKGGIFNQTLFSSTTSDGSETWSVSDSLVAGSDYSLKIFSLDYNSILDTSTSYFTISKDWFIQNLSDSGIISQMRTLTADNILSRNDAIAVLGDTKDGGTIDNNEFNDLQTIVANFANAASTNLFTTENYVRVLTNKVVNADLANANYQKTALGNLSAGSNATHMDKLINKWFLGLDRPDTTDFYNGTVYQYQFVSGGALFQNEASDPDEAYYTDIYQGTLGDCYFLAALASTAFRDSSKIQDMFIDNGDNTYTVRFYKDNGEADYVTVDRYLPVYTDGTFIYARQKAADWGKPTDAQNEWWYALAEKAYAQLNESGWIGQDGTNSYSGIIEGFEYKTIKHVAGLTTTQYNSLNSSNIINAFNAGAWITIGSKSPLVGNIVEGHAYVMVGYEPATENEPEKFKLFNPWGIGADPERPGLVELTWSEIEDSFENWTSNYTLPA